MHCIALHLFRLEYTMLLAPYSFWLNFLISIYVCFLEWGPNDGNILNFVDHPRYNIENRIILHSTLRAACTMLCIFVLNWQQPLINQFVAMGQYTQPYLVIVWSAVVKCFRHFFGQLANTKPRPTHLLGVRNWTSKYKRQIRYRYELQLHVHIYKFRARFRFIVDGHECITNAELISGDLTNDSMIWLQFFHLIHYTI